MFLQQSNQVNAWDRMLADSGEKVSNYITPDCLWCDSRLFIINFLDFVGCGAK